jgi:hypothetical protein
MGAWGKIALYTGIFALGFGVCYTSCVNKDYEIVEENGRMYVEDKDTGRRSRVRDFDIDSRKGKDRDLKSRLDDAYDALAR